MRFPIDMSAYKALKLDYSKDLTDEELKQLKTNIQLARDAIVFFTAHAGARGLGGHTGGAYDIVPEALIADGFMRGSDVYPVHFDEAGHRVALQYLLCAIDGDLTFEQLLKYREHKGLLPGHPEMDITPGVKFSSGRLGHLWAYANGVAVANPDKRVVLFGSDGSQQEGDDAEAARQAVAMGLNIKLFIDDNDITIAGHPSEYMKGYDIQKTLEGHGLKTDACEAEDIEALYKAMQKAFQAEGPYALINKRPMAPGIPNIEGTSKGHDVVDKDSAVRYLEARGYAEAVQILKDAEKVKDSREYLGSSKEQKKNRSEFGKIVCDILEKKSDDERRKFLVIDNDLEGSTGIKPIGERFPEIYRKGGVMERGNFSLAAGFGKNDRQGIFATFSAFLEMVISEITMARLNGSNVLAHFSHAGVDAMADNTCHYGVNNFFADNGLPETDKTRLYFPADHLQMKAILEKIFEDEGLRFIFSTRSGTPMILKEDSTPLYEDYMFTGKDEIIRSGKSYIVSYGEMLYRALDVVERLRKEGVDIGLINKPLLNIPDEDMLKKLSEARSVLVVESQNINTGLGMRFGTWLLKNGFKGSYSHVGTYRGGQGGIHEHIPYQGLDPESIMKKARELL